MLSALRVEPAGGASTDDPALPGTSRARGRRFGSPAAVSSSGRCSTTPLAARQPSSAMLANSCSAGASCGCACGRGWGCGWAGSSGGVTGTSVVGGDAEAFAAARPVLEVL
ncbi:hypothetical protein, partial [Pseudonocardia zijingensis]|uniref:hypothetical protein n=1 Tax=Pseudonocardia zijingensis TaxID=153376 RepID=UPI0031CFDA63